MNKLFTKVASLGLGLAMAVGVGVAVASNKKVSSVDAAISDTEASGLSVLTSSNFDTSAEYVLKSTDGYYWNGVSGTSSSKWGGITKTNSAVERVTISGTWSGGFTIEDSSGNYLRATTGNMTWATTQPGTFKMGTDSASHPIVYNGTSNGLKVNGTSGMRLYTNLTYNASTGKSVALYKIPATKTLSSISVSGYTTAFTVGDTFAFGGTVTAHYSDSTSANVTSSATFSGYNMNTAGNYTVTASYTESGVTKTATYGITVSAATTPTISLNGSSFTGYTGQSFSVTATYSNLSSAFAWSTSGAGTTTETITSTGTSTDGTSTYSGTLTGAGTKTITATGGGASSASYTVNITKTTVDITKSSTSISVGRSETLAASHNASSVGGLNWTSSNDSVAAVGSDGKVTVASGATVGATVTITATSSVDTSVSDTCTVTVIAAPLDTTYDFVENFSTYASSWSGYSSKTLDGKTNLAGDYAATVTLPYASKQTGTITTMPVLADQVTGDVIHISFELTESGYTLGDVSVTFVQWGTKAPTMKLFKGTTATGDALDTGVIGTKNTISASSVGGTTFVVAMNDNSTSRNQVGIQSIYISLVKENALDHVTVSFTSDPADRTFYAGSNFAFNGTLTASYTADSPKTVTPSGYFLEGEEGTGEAITTSDILNVADHNDADVYVQYKEGGVTKYDTFTLVVNPALATSVTLSANVGSVALEEAFEVSSITATVNPEAYATQGVTWDIYDLDGLTSSDYAYSNGEFTASKPADVVFHVKANSDNSVYAVFTLTITGDPIVHLLDGSLNDVTDGSANVFGDEGILTYGVTTENFEGTISYGWSTNNSSVIAIDDDQGDMCDFEVKGPAGLARLSCHVTGSTKGDVTVYIDVTVTAVTVTSVTWTAPTIDVYSGTSLSSTSGWNVKYSTNSGKTDQTPDSFKVMLGGSEISLPHEWTAADNGKALGVQVGGVNSSTTTTVAVTQSINNVYKPAGDTNTVSWTATASSDLGSQISSQGGTDEGTISTGDYSWDYTRTLISLASNKSDYISFQGETWIQLGSGNALESIEFTTSAIPGTIKSVSVVAATAGSHALTIDVDGTKYLENESLHVYTGTAAAANPDPSECVKTATGNASGPITITIAPTASTKKAMVIRSISVTYETEGSGDPTNIANDVSHKAAQRAAVAYAMAFNAAMDETENCTTGLAAAWATCSSAYTSFKSAAAALGSTEQAYALNLVKYATAQYSDDSGEACIERMMKTYEVCVQKHGMTEFMDDLVSLDAPRTSNLNVLRTSGNVAAVVTVVSLIGATAVGGYFFLRKRKETN